MTTHPLRFRRAVERVHRLGPQVVGELLSGAGVASSCVERFANLDRYPASFLSDIGADRWPPSIFGVPSS